MAEFGGRFNVGCSLPSCSFQREGYTFGGWNTETDGSGTYHEDNAVVRDLTSVPGATVVLYAQWVPNKYSIRFDANDGYGIMADQTDLEYDSAYVLAANTFARSGYLFDGWNTRKDGRGTAYKDKDSIINLTAEPDGIVTLYAQWKCIINAEISGITDKTYTGNPITQNITVSIKANGTNVPLTEGRDYLITYSNNTDVGIATLTITGIGDYTGVKASNFRILFKDVSMSHSFSKSVYWAVDNGIAKGYTGNRTGLYGVNDTITRGQVVMFLWRAAGRPEPAGSSMTFSDVPTTHSFYKAIQWAYENKITTGYKSGPNAGKFGVNDNCTRGQIVTFMLRYKRLSDPGAGPAGTSQTFNDVPTNHSFYNAIQWAYENKITTGYKDGSGNFGVNDSCTRGQCVTFLYRVMN